MSNSPNLALPYIAANQAQKHVTHNDAVALIDGLLQLSVLSRGLNAPPPRSRLSKVGFRVRDQSSSVSHELIWRTQNRWFIAEVTTRLLYFWS